MTTDRLRAMIDARPFVPFIMHMADGRNVEVNHPELIAYGGGRIAAVMNATDVVAIVDLLLVPSLEPNTRPSNSGRPRRRREGSG